MGATIQFNLKKQVTITTIANNAICMRSDDWHIEQTQLELLIKMNCTFVQFIISVVNVLLDYSSTLLSTISNVIKLFSPKHYTSDFLIKLFYMWDIISSKSRILYNFVIETLNISFIVFEIHSFLRNLPLEGAFWYIIV